MSNLPQAFHSECRLNNSTTDWYVDSGATAHMAPYYAHIDSFIPYNGKEQVIFGNGNILHVTKVDTTSLSSRFPLCDVLIVPHIKKKLLSVSKLTNNLPIDVLFSRSYFAIQDTTTKEILAKRRHTDGLYILSSGSQAFFFHPLFLHQWHLLKHGISVWDISLLMLFLI